MSRCLVLIFPLLVATSLQAAENPGVVVMTVCDLKSGKTLADAQKVTDSWLAIMTRKHPGKRIESKILLPLIGDTRPDLVFIDGFEDEVTFGQVKMTERTEASEVMSEWGETARCNESAIFLEAN